MKDTVIPTQPELSTLENAVSYILQRMRHDANLRHYMLGTQAFALLCEAEAERICLLHIEVGYPPTMAAKVEEQYSTLDPNARPQEPDVVRLRRENEALQAMLESKGLKLEPPKPKPPRDDVPAWLSE